MNVGRKPRSSCVIFNSLDSEGAKCEIGEFIYNLRYRINYTDIWPIKKFGQPMMKLKWKISFIPCLPQEDNSKPLVMSLCPGCGDLCSALANTGSSTFLKGHIHCRGLEPFATEDSPGWWASGAITLDVERLVSRTMSQGLNTFLSDWCDRCLLTGSVSVCCSLRIPWVSANSLV